MISVKNFSSTKFLGVLFCLLMQSGFAFTHSLSANEYSHENQRQHVAPFQTCDPHLEECELGIGRDGATLPQPRNCLVDACRRVQNYPFVPPPSIRGRRISPVSKDSEDDNPTDTPTETNKMETCLRECESELNNCEESNKNHCSVRHYSCTKKCY